MCKILGPSLKKKVNIKTSKEKAETFLDPK